MNPKPTPPTAGNVRLPDRQTPRQTFGEPTRPPVVVPPPPPKPFMPEAIDPALAAYLEALEARVAALEAEGRTRG